MTSNAQEQITLANGTAIALLELANQRRTAQYFAVADKCSKGLIVNVNLALIGWLLALAEQSGIGTEELISQLRDKHLSGVDDA